MSDGRPKGFPSTGLEKQPPYGLAVAHPRPPVGREGSKRSVVAAAGVMVWLRKRWIMMELGLLMMGAEGPVGRR